MEGPEFGRGAEKMEGIGGEGESESGGEGT